MKICVITVYDSINSGSFWQAKSLEIILQNMGHKVYFLKRVGNKAGSSSSKSNQVKKYLSLLLNQGFEIASLYRKRLVEYKNQINSFETITIDNAADKIDCFILGSDTIWNLDSNYFLSHRSEYWGEPFFSKKVITYAGSAANTSINKLNEFPELIGCVNKWSFISVRDSHTKEMISSITDKEVSEVCDPTLLLTSGQYSEKNQDIKYQNFIFLYLFKPLNSSQTEELNRFAQENNLIIIQGAGDSKFNGVDSMSINDPYHFISYMKAARYILTDTFHGTIFSTIFEKDFVVIERGKQKVEDFLGKIQLTNRIADLDGSIVSILNNHIDYTKPRSCISEMRVEGLNYLKAALEES